MLQWARGLGHFTQQTHAHARIIQKYTAGSLDKLPRLLTSCETYFCSRSCATWWDRASKMENSMFCIVVVVRKWWTLWTAAIAPPTFISIAFIYVLVHEDRDYSVGVKTRKTFITHVIFTPPRRLLFIKSSSCKRIAVLLMDRLPSSSSNFNPLEII
jgi:hypothetical protein